MTHVSHLAVGALPCNWHVNYVSPTHIKIQLFKLKAIHNSYLFTMLIVLKALLNEAKSQYVLNSICLLCCSYIRYFISNEILSSPVQSLDHGLTKYLL